MQNNITLLLVGENSGDIVAFKSKLKLLREIDSIKDVEYDGSFDLIKKFFPCCVFIFGDDRADDACDMCRQIKRDSVLSNIPMVFITKTADEELIKKYFESGADNCFNFTIKDYQLKANVDLYLKKRQDFYNLSKQTRLLKNLDIKFENDVVTPNYVERVFENELEFSKKYDYPAAFMALSFEGDDDIFAILKNSTRQNDIIGQISSNIFYVLLPETLIGGAYKVYKKIKNLLDKNTKLSAGACEYEAKMSFDSLSKKALKALKEASIIGNNIVITDKFDEEETDGEHERDYKIFTKLYTRKLKNSLEPSFRKAKETFNAKYETNVSVDDYITFSKSYFSIKNIKSEEEAVLKIYYNGMSKISMETIYFKNGLASHNYTKVDMKDFTSANILKMLDNLSFEFDKLVSVKQKPESVQNDVILN